MLLHNFKIDDEKKSLIGISGSRLKQFLKRFAETHRTDKLYCMKIVEVNASQLSQNYLFTILGRLSKETGNTTDRLQKVYLKKLDDLILSELDDNYSKDLFYDNEATDTTTGELLEPKLKTISQFNDKAMSLFIDLVITYISRDFPDFKIPNGAEYFQERKGKKNKILFPNEKINLQ